MRTWALRQFGINENLGTNRRIWIVPKGDSLTFLARLWHSFRATLNAFHPFGESNHVIGANTLEDAYSEMKRRGLLRPRDRITFLEFAGHGAPGGFDVTPGVSFLNAADVRGQSALPLNHRNPTAQILTEIGARFSPDAEVRFNACEIMQGGPNGEGGVLLREMSALMGGRRVTANDAVVALTGRGQWYTTTPNGNIEFDTRWGSVPQIGDAAIWLRYVLTCGAPAKRPAQVGPRKQNAGAGPCPIHS